MSLLGVVDVWAGDKVAAAAIARNRVAHTLCQPVKSRDGPVRAVGLLLDDEAGTMAAHRPPPRAAWDAAAVDFGVPKVREPGHLCTFEAAISSNERPERTEAAARYLRESGVAARCVALRGRPATAAELRLVHSAAHVDASLGLDARHAELLRARRARQQRAQHQAQHHAQQQQAASGPAQSGATNNGADCSGDDGGGALLAREEAALLADVLRVATSRNTVFMNEHSVAAARFACGGVIDAVNSVVLGLEEQAPSTAVSTTAAVAEATAETTAEAPEAATAMTAAAMTAEAPEAATATTAAATTAAATTAAATMAGRRRLEGAVCAVRPPGHHAGCCGGMGFGIFDTVRGRAHLRARASLRLPHPPMLSSAPPS